ncbi:MAG: hypothetical protein HC890_11810 [Chloroflexaceae bacterium]|nr:hypothetical protein [Chloroflexaceae bacterium]
MIILLAVFVIGWVAAAAIGSQAYFRGEQNKPIHERNWRSQSFEQIAKSVTGADINYGDRVPSFAIDAYYSRELPNN